MGLGVGLELHTAAASKGVEEARVIRTWEHLLVDDRYMVYSIRNVVRLVNDMVAPRLE